MSPKHNRCRVIGGRWRGRFLEFPDSPDLRPTPDRVRETLFNWLQARMYGARCLDPFAGSGALSFEAVSRGAAEVVALDSAKAAITALESNQARLRDERLRVIHTDALNWLSHVHSGRPFDIVFMDPPFAADHLLEQGCRLLAQNAWLAHDALVYLESGAPLDSLQLPEPWTLEKHKRAGQVHYGLVSACTHSL